MTGQFRPGPLQSLQTRLVLAFAGIVLAALALAGLVFVLARRGDQAQRALDRVFAESPELYGEFSLLDLRGTHSSRLPEFVAAAAERYGVRILVLDGEQRVVEDSEGKLTGVQLARPGSLTLVGGPPGRHYVSWRPESGPASDLVLLTTSRGARNLSPLLPDLGRRDAGYWLALAVPETTITRAWLDLLPSLSVAGAIALPAAVLLALVVARQVTRPLLQLTQASMSMAEGSFDVSVPVERRDEVGQLARAFDTMVRRVGASQAQMRRLVSDVSHDLKTPLTSILGFSRALETETDAAPEPGQVRHMGGIIREEAERLAGRLNDLLYLSEIESGGVVLQPSRIDLPAMIERLVTRIKPELAGREVTVDQRLSEAPALEADAQKLERALENLLDNARKFTPAGGTVRVSAGQAGDEAVIEIASTAAGLSEEELPRLFERFYRAPTPLAAAGARHGSGLGLAIARDLVTLHGGAIGARLEDGLLVFTIRLPRRPPGGGSGPAASH